MLSEKNFSEVKILKTENAFCSYSSINILKNQYFVTFIKMQTNDILNILFNCFEKLYPCHKYFNISIYVKLLNFWTHTYRA